MSITVPAPGDAITVTDFGSPVALQLNRLVPLVLVSDILTNSASWSDLATCTVTAGVSYTGTLIIRWAPSATNMGAGLGLNGPAASAFSLYMNHYNGADGTVATSERVTGYDTGGVTSADNTNARESVMRFVITFSAGGTLAIRGKRGGTSGTGITFSAGSGGLITASA